MEEWKEYRYTDIATLIGGGTPKTSNPSYWGGNIPWLSVKDFGNDAKYVYQTEKTITEEGLNNSSTKLLQKDDIIISARGTIGEMAMIPFPMSFNQSCFGIRGKENVDKDFLYYLTKTKINNLKSSSHGSVFDTITRATFDNIIVSLPSLPTQQKIANILSSLDDKIEVNRRINEQLEELAQALFKSWFVDFEPFKDGDFVESELGMIPKGWKVCEIKDFGDVVCGKTPSKDNKDYYGGNIPFIKIPDMHGNVFVENTEDWLSEEGNLSQIKKRIPPYSICVSCIATVGLVAINSTYAHTNQQINTIIPNNKHERYYLFNQLRLMKEYIQNLGRGGTATLNVNTKTFSSIKVLMPTEKVLKDYDNVVSCIFEKIENNQQEMTHLTTLRDTLLPKLMSGEIDVNEVEI